MPDPVTPPVDTQLEHEVAMLTKSIDADPSQIPAQFAGSKDNFIKSYREQRRTLTQAQQELAALKATPPAPTPSATPPVADTGEFFKPADVATPGQIPWGLIQQEIKVTGKLTDATRKLLNETHGVPLEVIAAHEESFRLKQEKIVSEAAALVGGTAQLEAVKRWVQTNCKPEEMAAINEGMSKPGWQNILLGIRARMSDPTSGEPAKSPAASAGTPATGVKRFANQHEVQNAVNDPRYGRDDEYTKSVYARMAATR